jgi:hypothetical protein
LAQADSDLDSDAQAIEDGNWEDVAASTKAYANRNENIKEIHSGVKTNVKIGIRMDIITKQSCQNNVIWNSMYVCLEVLG